MDQQAREGVAPVIRCRLLDPRLVYGLVPHSGPPVVQVEERAGEGAAAVTAHRRGLESLAARLAARFARSDELAGHRACGPQGCEVIGERCDDLHRPTPMRLGGLQLAVRPRDDVLPDVRPPERQDFLGAQSGVRHEPEDHHVTHGRHADAESLDLLRCHGPRSNDSARSRTPPFRDAASCLQGVASEHDLAHCTASTSIRMRTRSAASFSRRVQYSENSRATPDSSCFS